MSNWQGIRRISVLISLTDSGSLKATVTTSVVVLAELRVWENHSRVAGSACRVGVLRLRPSSSRINCTSGNDRLKS